MQARSRGGGGGAGAFAVCVGVCACALPIPKEGPLGTILVRFNTWLYKTSCMVNSSIVLKHCKY